MTFLRASALSPVVFLVISTAFGQVAPPVAGVPPVTPPSTQQPTAPPTAAPPAKNVPDYPEPRTLTLGVFYWDTGPGINPSIYGGSQATQTDSLGVTTSQYSNFSDLGRAHRTPGFEIYFPITRTGELHIEAFKTVGNGDQIAPVNTTVFQQSVPQGAYVATQWNMERAKVYLDDLLWPEKFPVPKFRLKSLWEVQWMQIHSSVDTPILDATGNGAPATGTRSIIYPELGVAAEYQLTRHVLLRASLAGFGFPHKADIADADATISYRRGLWEVRAGGQMMHYKTSTDNLEYLVGTMTGVFVGLRFHWLL